MNDDQELRWTADLGALLRRARGAMPKREAARRAGFSESTWRALELGVRRPAKGIEVPVNPTVGTLLAAADAVGVARSEVLAAAGLDGDGVDGDGLPGAYGTDGDGASSGSLAERVTRLEDQMQEALTLIRELSDRSLGGRGARR